MDLERIRELFSSFRPVDVRRMFGGAGVYADGVMFALLSSGGTMYLKVGEGNEAEFLRENLPPFAPTTKNGRHAVMPYRQMPDRLYDDPEELALWAAKALQVASAKARPAGRGKPKAKLKSKPKLKSKSELKSKAKPKPKPKPKAKSAKKQTRRA